MELKSIIIFVLFSSCALLYIFISNIENIFKTNIENTTLSSLNNNFSKIKVKFKFDNTNYTFWRNFMKNYQKVEKSRNFQFSPKLLVNPKSDRQSSRRRNKRQVPCQTGEELDEYVDSLFGFIRRLVRVMEPFETPNATIELEQYNLQIFLHSGQATNLEFHRAKPAWVLCSNETTSLGMTIGIDDTRVAYKYRVIQDWRLLFDGDLEAQIKHSKAQLQMTQLNEQESEDDDGEEESMVEQRIDKLKIWTPGKVKVLIRGLGNLSSTLSMIINQLLEDTSYLEPFINQIETSGLEAANEMLKNVTIPFFSVI